MYIKCISATRNSVLHLLKPLVKEDDMLSIKNSADELLRGSQSHLEVSLADLTSFASPNPLYFVIS